MNEYDKLWSTYAKSIAAAAATAGCSPNAGSQPRRQQQQQQQQRRRQRRDCVEQRVVAFDVSLAHCSEFILKLREGDQNSHCFPFSMNQLLPRNYTQHCSERTMALIGVELNIVKNYTRIPLRVALCSHHIGFPNCSKRGAEICIGPEEQRERRAWLLQYDTINEYTHTWTKRTSLHLDDLIDEKDSMTSCLDGVWNRGRTRTPVLVYMPARTESIDDIKKMAPIPRLLFSDSEIRAGLHKIHTAQVDNGYRGWLRPQTSTGRFDIRKSQKPDAAWERACCLQLWKDDLEQLLRAYVARHLIHADAMKLAIAYNGNDPNALEWCAESTTPADGLQLYLEFRCYFHYQCTLSKNKEAVLRQKHHKTQILLSPADLSVAITPIAAVAAAAVKMSDDTSDSGGGSSRMTMASEDGGGNDDNDDTVVECKEREADAVDDDDDDEDEDEDEE